MQDGRGAEDSPAIFAMTPGTQRHHRNNHLPYKGVDPPPGACMIRMR